LIYVSFQGIVKIILAIKEKKRKQIKSRNEEINGDGYVFQPMGGNRAKPLSKAATLTTKARTSKEKA
jgi:hypothetical protein